MENEIISIMHCLQMSSKKTALKKALNLCYGYIISNSLSCSKQSRHYHPVIPLKKQDIRDLLPYLGSFLAFTILVSS